MPKRLRAGPAGKLLITDAGRLRTCQCCAEPPEVDEFKLHANCCGQCKGIYLPESVYDHCPGEQTGFKWTGNGQCYLSGGTGPTLTRAEAEATGRPVVWDLDEITCRTQSCAEDQEDEICPPCTECCVFAYLSKECFVGGIPSNSHDSVCCNLGREVLFVSTRSVSWVESVFNGFTIDETGCHFNTTPRNTLFTNAEFVENSNCLFQARCPFVDPCLELLESGRVRNGFPDPGVFEGDCSVNNSGGCGGSFAVFDFYSYCSPSTPHPGTGTPPPACSGSWTDRLDPNDLGEPGAGCGLETWPCHSLIIDYSWTCARNCRGGTSSNFFNRRVYNYSQGFFCPGHPCESQLPLPICTLLEWETLDEVYEWQVIKLSDDGCNSNNTCEQYNEGCLEAELIEPPEERCSDPECHSPPDESSLMMRPEHLVTEDPEIAPPTTDPIGELF